ncbi:MAG: hypothetical protein ACFE8P_13055 [Promethearchaeota archaeon]
MEPESTLRSFPPCFKRFPMLPRLLRLVEIDGQVFSSQYVISMGMYLNLEKNVDCVRKGSYPRFKWQVVEI